MDHFYPGGPKAVANPPGQQLVTGHARLARPLTLRDRPRRG